MFSRVCGRYPLCCTAGVCAGQGTLRLAAFEFILEADASSGTTLEDIPSSVTTVRELESAISTALGIPTTVIQAIQVSLHSNTSSRRLVQASNLAVSVTLNQEMQPIANQEILSMVRQCPCRSSESQKKTPQPVACSAYCRQC